MVLAAERDGSVWWMLWASMRPADSARTDSYLAIDMDHDGMLSPQELRAWENRGFTDEFISRVFEEVPTFDGLLVPHARSPFVRDP